MYPRKQKIHLAALAMFFIAFTGKLKAENSSLVTTSGPVAYDITMTPLVHPSGILPLNAISSTGIISSYTVITIPSASQGILSIDMNGVLLPVSEGMMLTADLAGKLVFEPDTSYTGNVIFTYNASDEEGVSSNVAIYTIPVIGKQQVILPVTLLQFDGTEKNRKAELIWQTENEGNSSYFEIQRSIDGNDFEAIATVTAKGNKRINQYQYPDDLFFYNYKSAYYRLKMVNINGSYKYSGTVVIKLNNAKQNNIAAWPLPFNTNLTISYNSEKETPVQIIIHNVNGSKLISINSNVKKGINNISLYQAQTLPTGAYLLTISNGSRAETIKVIKE